MGGTVLGCTVLRWRNKKFSFLQTQKFQKILKAMKNLQFFETFKRNFAIFRKVFINWSKFSRKFMENIENYGNMHLYDVRERILPKVAKLLKT